jgi:molybdopterin converting factor small subunit
LATLIFNGSLTQFTNGQTECEVHAKNIKSLLGEIQEKFPRLSPLIESEGFAIAIDGEIFQDIWFAPISDSSEVHLIPPIGGG